MPARTSRDSVLPNPAVKRKPPIASAIASRSSREQNLADSSDCARSSALACVKWTTYAGARSTATSSSSSSCSGCSDHENTSGTGRSASSTSAVSRPVRRVRSSRNDSTSPSVADISRNCACGSIRIGTCQAHPRCGSA